MTTLSVPSRSLGILLLLGCTAAADWPQFRGPQGTGVSEEHGLPVRWSAKENLVWKTQLPGPGSSSPIVCGERIFVTSYSGYGPKTGSMAELRRHLVCLDRSSGKVVWQADVPARLPEVAWTGRIGQHGYATSTPVTDGEHVFVVFGRTGVLAYDLTGKELWRTEVGDQRNAFGSGASPVLYRNLVIVNASVESGRLVALDKTTGKVVWRVRIYDDCWTTPLLVEVPGGRHELVWNTPGVLLGLDPESGKELWRCECPDPDYVSASPVARGGIVYVMGAGRQGHLFQAVRAGGQGDVTKTRILWRQKVGASFCSPVLAGEHLYFFSDKACCLRADNGAIVFQERLAGLDREYSSPVAADGKIYLFTRQGKGHVLAVKDRLEPLAKNELGDADEYVASPAVSGGRIFVRSKENLYCIGESK